MSTILVTGANRGIGLEHVRQAVDAGDRAIAACRAPDSAGELRQLANTHGDRLRIEALDAADGSSVEALAERLTGEGIDILINNAGIIGSTPWTPDAPDQSLEGMDFAQWQAVLEVNLLGPFRVTAALRSNLLAGRARTVVMISSDLASISGNTMGGSHAYRSSKAGLNMVVRGLAADTAADGFTIVALTPGWTQTDMGGRAATWPLTESVKRQRAVIAGLSRADSGRFIDLNGNEVAW